MPRAPMLHRPPQRRDAAGSRPLRAVELVSALLSVVALGALALAAAFALAGDAATP